MSNIYTALEALKFHLRMDSLYEVLTGAFLGRTESLESHFKALKLGYGRRQRYSATGWPSFMITPLGVY